MAKSIFRQQPSDALLREDAMALEQADLDGDVWIAFTAGEAAHLVVEDFWEFEAPAGGSAGGVWGMSVGWGSIR